ncbi:MAG: glutathione S-transferase family protein [Hyphomicrobiales bacterium]|nr:glutathione S-transferase family protein [Hyphomicrobiales bacterium]
MGLLVDGGWQDEQPGQRTSAGRFVRPVTRFRNWITADGSPGATGHGGFAAARGRYHLYVAWPCPWAHRTIIMRVLKRLDDVITMSVVEPLYGPHGWRFGDSPGTIPDTVNHKSELAEIYLLADPKYTGRVSVPVLWDKERGTIVNNESAEIIRMLNGAFGEFTNIITDYYPPPLRAEIDGMNALIYENINNGVYRAGFATTQEAYEEAFRGVFGALDEVEARLAHHRYVVHGAQTEADWRLFCTLVRFDAVYYSHFKCNLRRIVDFPNLSGYLRDLYQHPGIAATVNMDHIKRHYYGSQRHVNPTGIVPLGPLLDLDAPHDRDRLAA